MLAAFALLALILTDRRRSRVWIGRLAAGIVASVWASVYPMTLSTSNPGPRSRC